MNLGAVRYGLPRHFCGALSGLARKNNATQAKAWAQSVPKALRAETAFKSDRLLGRPKLMPARHNIDQASVCRIQRKSANPVPQNF
jgi:hypothetical protein